MQAHFHCLGTTDVEKEMLNSLVSGLEKIGAPRRKNQAGSKSKPVAVGRRRSRILKTCCSVMYC